MQTTSESESPIKIVKLDGAFDLAIFAGKPVFVIGRNGTGKSALLHRINFLVTGFSIYLPGSRPLHFDQESLTMTAASRLMFTTHLQSNDQNPDVRWKPINGTSRNEKAIHDLQNAEVQYNTNVVRQLKRDGANSETVALLLSESSPLERLNNLLKGANLPIQMQIENGETRATQNSQVYSYAKMSDGERSALLIAAEVITAKPRSIFIVDEPEIHLHPSIVIPLLQSLITERPDCGFIIGTHELGLPAVTSDSEIIFVRGCTWTNPMVPQWHLDYLPDSNVIPDDVKLDVLGSRKKILFIEGTSSSLDAPLYALLFSDISVAARESCTAVIRAVTGLRAVEKHHNVQAFGLIDSDGISSTQVIEFESQYIFPLQCFAVESLYYDVRVQQAVALKQEANLGITAAELLSEAKRAALASLGNNGVVENLAAKLAERKIKEAVSAQIPQKEEIISRGVIPVEVSIPSPYIDELDKLKGLVQQGDLDSIIEKYSVRESGALGRIANALRFLNRGDYEKVALTAISESEDLRCHIKSKLNNLSMALEL